MTTEFLEQPTAFDVVKLNVTDTEIQKMKDEFLPLTINGIDDKAGFKKVYDSRQVVKKTRVSLVKHASDLKQSALAWQRKVNAEQNRVVEELESIEAHLQAEEDKVLAEKERIRLEAEAAEQARIQKRIDILAVYGYAIDLSLVQSISDEQFSKVLDNAREEHEKELAQKAEADRLQKEEGERIKAEREELEILRKQQAEAQRIIDEQNAKVRKEQEEKEAAIRDKEKRIENAKLELELQKQREEQARLREIELEQIRKDAAERARLQTIEDQRREEEAKAEKLAQSSDKVKFAALIEQLKNILIPEMKSRKAKALAAQTQDLISKVVAHISAGLS